MFVQKTQQFDQVIVFIVVRPYNQKSDQTFCNRDQDLMSLPDQ